MATAKTEAAPRLCPAHTELRRKWRLVVYNAANPREWPGGSHIMDSRTTHAQRREDWRRKTAEQVAQTEQICLRGGSPQCDWPGGRPDA